MQHHEQKIIWPVIGFCILGVGVGIILQHHNTESKACQVSPPVVTAETCTTSTALSGDDALVELNPQNEEAKNLEQLDLEQERLQKELAANRERLEQLTQKALDSTKRRLEAEAQLASAQATARDRRLFREISRLTKNAQITKLIDAADHLAESGEFASAATFLDRASDLAIGNVANERRVEEAGSRFIKALYKPN
jgi:hypothetical protein